MSATIILDKDEKPYTDTNPLPVAGVMQDIELGAVEIKNHDTDDRVEVDVNNALKTKLSLGGTDVSTSTPLPVEEVNKLVITRAIDSTGFDIGAGAFSSTTNISEDYFLDSLRLNFTTTESRTITVTGPDGTIIVGGSDDITEQNVLYQNTDLSIVIPFELGFDGGQNVTVDITQTTGACLADVILNISQGQTVLGGSGTTVTNDVSVVDKQYAKRIAKDSGDSNLEYIGNAEPGTSDSSASWQIKRVDTTSGTIILFADGDADFDNVWDDREGLSYS